MNKMICYQEWLTINKDLKTEENKCDNCDMGSFTCLSCNGNGCEGCINIGKQDCSICKMTGYAKGAIETYERLLLRTNTLLHYHEFDKRIFCDSRMLAIGDEPLIIAGGIGE